jgi:hypothetical protein
MKNFEKRYIESILLINRRNFVRICQFYAPSSLLNIIINKLV